MTVAKLRELLDIYNIERIYLTKEGIKNILLEDRKRKFRIKVTGNKKIKYTEGWVEFSDKKVARMVALSLNSTKMSKI